MTKHGALPAFGPYLLDTTERPRRRDREKVLLPGEVPTKPCHGVLVAQKQNTAGNEVASDHLMLHKTSKVSGFHIHATDGAIGHVDDFLFNEQWAIAYLVVDTSNWLGGKSVLISTGMVSHVDAPAKRIDVRLTRDEIKHGPSIDTADIELVETLPPFLIF